MTWTGRRQVKRPKKDEFEVALEALELSPVVAGLLRRIKKDLDETYAEALEHLSQEAKFWRNLAFKLNPVASERASRMRKKA